MRKVIIRNVPEDQADYYASEEALIDFGNGVEYKAYNEDYESSQLSSFRNIALVSRAHVPMFLVLFIFLRRLVGVHQHKN